MLTEIASIGSRENIVLSSVQWSPNFTWRSQRGDVQVTGSKYYWGRAHLLCKLTSACTLKPVDRVTICHELWALISRRLGADFGVNCRQVSDLCLRCVNCWSCWVFGVCTVSLEWNFSWLKQPVRRAREITYRSSQLPQQKLIWQQQLRR